MISLLKKNSETSVSSNISGSEWSLVISNVRSIRPGSDLASEVLRTENVRAGAQHPSFLIFLPAGESGESSNSSFMLELLENIQMKIENSEEGEEWSHQSVLQRSQTISIKEEEIEDADFKIVIGASLLVPCRMSWRT